MPGKEWKRLLQIISKYLRDIGLTSCVRDSGELIRSPSSFESAQKGDISFLLSPSLRLIYDFKGSALIVPERVGEALPVTIPCKNPKLAFIKVLQKFFNSPSAKAPYGCEGFGHEPDENGIYTRFPHSGSIDMHPSVQLGVNVVICRGSLKGKNTVISKHARIWHGVNIGHNCFIGKRSVILNNSTLCGSVTIGNDVWVAPAVAIMNQLTVGNNSVVGIGSVVTKNIPENEVWAGNPAKKIGDRDAYPHIMRSHRR